MKSCILQTRSVEVRHTSANISEALANCAEEWNITSKLASTTTDNARNIVNAVTINLSWFHRPCFAHTLQIAVRQGLQVSEVTQVLSRCRRLVSHFHHSYVASRALNTKQEQLHVPTRKLVQEVSTRWNSTFEMIERILEQRTALSAVLMESTKAVERALMLNNDEITILECTVKVLEPFAHATTMLCAEKLPSASIIKPVLTALVKKFLVISESEPVVATSMKNAILASINSHFQDASITKATLIASALDPRHKALKFLKSTEREEVFANVMEQASFLADLAHESPSSPKRPKLSAVVSDLLDYSESTSSDSSGTQSPLPQLRGAVEREVHFYRSDEAIGKLDNPLMWWKNNEHRFCTLSKLARRYLCMQATSVPAERLFSKAGVVVCRKRASLNPSTVDCLLSLHHNW